MIENLSKKRMVFGISCLILLTIVVLIIESKWMKAGTRRQQEFVIENNSTSYCWRESYEVIKDCHPCTAFEIASKSQGVCVHTHNKEVLKCLSGEIVTRSCDRVAWLDEKHFWSFQISLTIVGCLATAVSFLRQKSLNRRAMLKIQNQLGTC
uniref:Protein JTB n=1 Tax=Culex tarsalis TaxID=7177 RepID=A0A1Q3FDK4_CULTA